MNCGTVKNNAQKGLQAQVGMKSAGNGGIAQGGLQMLHVHGFLAAPLGTGHMAESGADQHEGRIAIRENAHHRVRWRISRLSRSITLLVRMRVQCSYGNSQ